MEMNSPQYSIDPRVRIGHVHLKVADLKRSLRFYCDVLGFKITQRCGADAAFISSGVYHHHIGLNTWQSSEGLPPGPNTTGLYHFAILYPTRREFAEAFNRISMANVLIDGASDHGVSEAIYLRDPDNNGIELYWDRPVEQWPKDENGELAMTTKSLNRNSLLEEINLKCTCTW